MTPLLLSKVSLIFGFILLGLVLFKKYQLIQSLPKDDIFFEKGTFKDFWLENFESLRQQLGEIWRAFKHNYYRVIAFILHSLKLVSLKLESSSTRWLSKIKTASENHKVQSEKINKNTKNNDLFIDIDKQAKKLEIQDYFTALKDTPNHDKLKDKLSLLKKDKRESSEDN